MSLYEFKDSRRELEDCLMYKDPNRRQRSFKKHHLPPDNYKDGHAYFVTVCANRRQPLFVVPELEAILRQQWRNLTQRFPSVSLDRFVIMRDHIHFILWIKPDGEKTPSLSQIIQAYKSLCAVAWLDYLKENNMNKEGRIWQRGYYDRIVRRDELEKTRRYIENNPIVAKLGDSGDVGKMGTEGEMGM